MRLIKGRLGTRCSVLAPAVTILLLSLVIGACGDDESTDSGGASGAASTTDGSDKKDVSIAMEQVLTGVAFAQQSKQGAEAAAKELAPVSLTIQGPPSIDPVLAQKQVTDAIAKGPDAIGITAFPPEVWQRTLKTAVDQVDTAIAFNVPPISSPAEAPNSTLKTFVGVNDKQSAADVATKVIELAKLGPDTTGTVLAGQCVAGNSGVLYQRVQGFTEVVKAKLPKATVKTFDSKVDPQGNTSTWDQTLKANPNPVLAWGTCDQDGTSLYKLKKQSGAKFPVAAMETPPETILGIKDGSILVTSSVPWYLEGYVTARILAEGARGTKPPEGFVDVGTTLVTTENLATITKRDASAAGAAAYYAPIIEKFFGDLQANVKPLADAFS